MEVDQKIIQEWVSSLKRWGCGNWVASFLEAAGPLNVLFAQIVYFTQPLINWTVSDDRLVTLARMLEEPTRLKAFTLLLRETEL